MRFLKVFYTWNFGVSSINRIDAPRLITWDHFLGKVCDESSWWCPKCDKYVSIFTLVLHFNEYVRTNWEVIVFPNDHLKSRGRCLFTLLTILSILYIFFEFLTNIWCTFFIVIVYSCLSSNTWFTAVLKLNKLVYGICNASHLLVLVIYTFW